MRLAIMGSSSTTSMRSVPRAEAGAGGLPGGRGALGQEHLHDGAASRVAGHVDEPAVGRGRFW